MLLIQLIDHADSKRDAEMYMAHLALTKGFVGGRLLKPDSIYEDWRIQIFWKENTFPRDRLPVHCRLVEVLEKQLAILGIRRELL